MDLPSPVIAPFDFADARNRMVDSQVRPNKVTHGRILNAMREIPRERFVPGPMIARAYVDEDVPLGQGRWLMEPMVLARLLQLGLPKAGQRALVVAAGTGYSAAVLAGCGLAVVALEPNAAHAADARATLAALSLPVEIVSGPLAEGWAQGGPYDLILLDGAVLEIPPALGAQLTPGGRIVAVRMLPGQTGKGVVAEQTRAGLRAQAMFDCSVPLLPDLLPEPGFVF